MTNESPTPLDAHDPQQPIELTPNIEVETDNYGDDRGALPEQAERTGHFLTAEEEQNISDNLSDILERRIQRTEIDSEERANKLRNAIHQFPGALDSLLSSFSTHLDEAGVSSLEVYVLGGFAREASGELIDPDNGIDTSIRPDTDIDVVVRCIPKSGVKLSANRYPSPFTPIIRTWSENDISTAFDFTFYVAGAPKDLEPDKPKIELIKRDLSSVHI